MKAAAEKNAKVKFAPPTLPRLGAGQRGAAPRTTQDDDDDDLLVLSLATAVADQGTPKHPNHKLRQFFLRKTVEGLADLIFEGTESDEEVCAEEQGGATLTAELLAALPVEPRLMAPSPVAAAAPKASAAPPPQQPVAASGKEAKLMASHEFRKVRQKFVDLSGENDAKVLPLGICSGRVPRATMSGNVWARYQLRADSEIALQRGNAATAGLQVLRVALAVAPQALPEQQPKLKQA